MELDSIMYLMGTVEEVEVFYSVEPESPGDWETPYSPPSATIEKIIGEDGRELKYAEYRSEYDLICETINEKL